MFFCSVARLDTNDGSRTSGNFALGRRIQKFNPIWAMSFRMANQSQLENVNFEALYDKWDYLRENKSSPNLQTRFSRTHHSRTRHTEWHSYLGCSNCQWQNDKYIEQRKMTGSPVGLKGYWSDPSCHFAKEVSHIQKICIPGAWLYRNLKISWIG